MSKRILITPRSLTQRHSPDLQALENAGYELVYARPGITPTEEELLDLVPDCLGLVGLSPADLGASVTSGDQPQGDQP